MQRSEKNHPQDFNESRPVSKVVESAIFRAVVDGLHDAIVVADANGAVCYLNPAAEEMFSSAETTGIFKLLSEISCNTGVNDTGSSTEFRHCLPSGRSKWYELREERIFFADENWTVFSLRDVNARKVRESELQRAATTDSLSGLTNRREFQAILESCVDREIALAIIDVDDFKAINDRCGHLCGDEAIEFLASKMKLHFGQALCLARLGGDEFAVLLSTERMSPDSAGERALWKRLTEFVESISVDRLVQQHGNTAGSEMKLTVSIGAAVSHSNTTARKILTVADASLYEAKRQGKNCVVVRDC